MTPERWREVKEVFQAVLELPASEQAARLAALDDATRREVESLIAAAPTHSGGFLETPPALGLVDDRIGLRVGPFRVVEELGRGGMGVVYRAVRDDDELRAEVALKVVKRGMDTEFVLRRFRAERQILAGMSHPNIARLLDAGTTDDGTPWFAMELVLGEPIDRYCEQRQLGIRDRLELFAPVCSAVHHAHQNLVVHRDLKPSNILVTADGRPVLLDFGIAKLLDPEADSTLTERAIMTPAYASPEQITGKPITTASDVYSLGVILYELLAGRRPYEVPTSQALEQAILRGDVPVASVGAARAGGDPRRTRQIRGDLDAIVAMAMRPAPDERYASPRELAHDLAAYLDGRPTLARRDGIAGRAWKLVRRHRLATLAIVAIAATLIGGVVATARQARIARAERARAERRSDEVRQLAGRLLFEIHDAIVDLPGATPARAQLVREARVYLERLADEAKDRPDLMLELSGAWLRLGDVQGNAASANLGEVGDARESYVHALAAAEQALALAPDNPAARIAVAAAVNRAGDARWTDGELALAAGEYERSIAIVREAVAKVPDDVEARHLLAHSLTDLADTIAPEQPERAAALHAEAMAVEEAVVAQVRDPRALRTLSLLHNRVGRRAVAAGDRRTALDAYRKALAIREELRALAPFSAGARRDVSSSLSLIGKLLSAEGDLAGARVHLQRALEIDEANAAADPTDVRALRDRAVSSFRIAELDHASAIASKGAERITHLRTARAGFARAIVIWRELEVRGGFVPGDDTAVAELEAAVASCDSALVAEGAAPGE